MTCIPLVAACFRFSVSCWLDCPRFVRMAHAWALRVLYEIVCFVVLLWLLFFLCVSHALPFADGLFVLAVRMHDLLACAVDWPTELVMVGRALSRVLVHWFVPFVVIVFATLCEIVCVIVCVTSSDCV